MVIIFLMDLGLILLGALIVSIGYLLIEKVSTSNVLLKLNLRNYARNIIEGFLYGFLFLLIAFIIKVTNPGSGHIPIYILGSISLIFIKDIIISAISFIPDLLYRSIIYDATIMDYVSISFFAILLIGSFIIKTLKENNNYIFLLVSVVCILGFITFISYDIAINKQLIILDAKKILFPFIYLWFWIGTIFISKKFLDSSNLLYEKINYNFSNYHREGLKKTAINNLIKNKIVERAVYGIVDFDFPKQEITERNVEIQETILIDLEDEFDSNVVLFKSDEKNFGFFMEVKNNDINLNKTLSGNNSKNRDDDDPLKIIENILKKRSISYKTSWNEVIKVKLKVYCSIYGIHDNSIDKLHDIANYTLQINKNFKTERKNIVQVYNAKKHMKKYKEATNVIDMNKKIGMDNFIDKYLFVENDKKQRICVLKVEKNDYTEIKENISNFVHFFGWMPIFDRYYSFNAIKKYPDEKIAFFYSPKIIADVDFDTKLFQEKIKNINGKTNNLIIIISYYQWFEINNKNLFFTKMKELRKLGVEFAIYKGPKFSKKDLIEIQPDYVVINNKLDKSWFEKIAIPKIFIGNKKMIDENQKLNIDFT